MAAEFELKAVKSKGWFLRNRYKKMASDLRIEIAKIKSQKIVL